MIPKNFIRGGRHYLESIDAKARICRSVVKTINRYSLFIRKLDHRGHAHFDLGGVFDSVNDAASAYEFTKINEPIRRKA